MNAATFQGDPDVLAFEDWIAPLLRGERRFQHRWQSPRWGEWACESLFDAFLGYDWPFSVVLPGTTAPTRGRSFADSCHVFDTLSNAFRSAIATGNHEGFMEAARAVVGWGGVRQNLQRLNALGADALTSLSAAATQLDPQTADLSQLASVADMNAGFSKIYSLLVDGFPIYDSRVACALASFVARFCHETGSCVVPTSLAFRLPPSRSAVRDPSHGSIRFRPLRHRQVREYADSNLRAAWLLHRLAHLGRFGELPEGQRILALQSALFMLGYERLPRPDPLAPANHRP